MHSLHRKANNQYIITETDRQVDLDNQAWSNYKSILQGIRYSSNFSGFVTLNKK